MGYHAWVPVLVRSYRTAAHGRSRIRAIKELPILPKFLLAAIPATVHGDLGAVRYFDRIERDIALAPLKIPSWQVEQFATELQAINDAETARARRLTAAKPDKTRWQRLTPQTLPEVMARLFGADS